MPNNTHWPTCQNNYRDIAIFFFFGIAHPITWCTVHLIDPDCLWALVLRSWSFLTSEVFNAAISFFAVDESSFWPYTRLFKKINAWSWKSVIFGRGQNTGQRKNYAGDQETAQQRNYIYISDSMQFCFSSTAARWQVPHMRPVWTTRKTRTSK